MRRRTRTNSFAKPSPIARLWALRILDDLKGHRSFIRSHGFSDDNLAASLGMDRWLDDDAFISGNVRDALTDLRALHRDAERNAGKTSVPTSLASNIAKLVNLAGLNDTDRQVLEFAVLMHDDPSLNAAAGCLENLTTAHACKALASILDLPEDGVRASLGRDGMLVRSGLLSVDHGHHDLPRKLDMISNDFAGRAMLPEMEPIDLLRGVVTHAPAAELHLDDYPHLAASLDILLPYLRHAKDTAKPGVNVFLHGQPGTGKTQLSRALAAHIGCELFEVACEGKDGDPSSGTKRLNALRAAQCFFGKGGALILFDEVEDIFNDGGFFGESTAQKNKGWMNRMLEGNGAPTLWLSNSIRGLDPAFVRRFDMMIEVAVPPRSQRERTARAICGDLVDDVTLTRISDSETLAPAVVTRAVNVIRSVGGRMNRQEASKATELLIDNILTAQGHDPLRANDANRLPDIYDPAFINTDADLMSIAEGLAASRSGRLCLYGPPGTGKTAYGRWLAQQLGMPLLVKRASDLLSKWIGEAEKNIAAAFRSAERDGAILLIDEVDSFLRERADAQRSWEVTQVNEMLTQMEAFPGIFIASTNLMHGLDQAALRRFDLKLKFDYLKPDQAIAMLQRHCETLGLSVPDAAAELLARQRLRHLTPGDFAAVMRRHRFRPIASNGELVAALQAECAIKADCRPAMGFVH